MNFLLLKGIVILVGLWPFYCSHSARPEMTDHRSLFFSQKRGIMPSQEMRDLSDWQMHYLFCGWAQRDRRTGSWDTQHRLSFLNLTPYRPPQLWLLFHRPIFGRLVFIILLKLKASSPYIKDPNKWLPYNNFSLFLEACSVTQVIAMGSTAWRRG